MSSRRLMMALAIGSMKLSKYTSRFRFTAMSVPPGFVAVWTVASRMSSRGSTALDGSRSGIERVGDAAYLFGGQRAARLAKAQRQPEVLPCPDELVHRCI